MEIYSVKMYNNNTLAKAEPVKQASTTEQQEVNTDQTKQVVTDSFTKSAAAEAISQQTENTSAKIAQTTVVAAETETKAATSQTTANSETAANQARPSRTGAPAKANTEETETTTSVVSDEITETTEEATQEATAIVSSVSDYSAAEIAEYDLNGDGELDAAEVAKMKAAQAKEAANQSEEVSQEVSQDEMSIEQLEAKEAYEIAKNQLLLTEDEPVINEQF